MRGLRRNRLTDFGTGLAAVVLVLVGVFFAFSKANPFADPYELSAIFEDVQNIKTGSPVRIAGVDVGQVTEVEAITDGSGGARVTMEIKDSGLPIHEDAEMQVRPRLFLEGNYVIELKPGSPSAPEIGSGSTLSADRTANSVSFDQVLAVLDKDTRANLRTLLDEYSSAFLEGGAEAFRASIDDWREAYRTTALASDALLGQRPGDLERVLRGQQRTLAALNQDPQALADLVTNLNVTTAAFAREDDALQASIPALRDVIETGLPSLASVNAALPSLRAFSRDALPGVRSSDETLDAAQPFVEQLRGLVGEDELQGVARQLRETIPALAELSEESVPFLTENRELSSCTENVLVPFAETPIPDPDFPEASGQPFYKEAQRGFVGLAGESRDGDANGQWFRVQAASSGANFVQLDGPLTEPLFASPLFQPLGVRPAPPRERPRFRPDVPCETQDPPNLAAPGGPATGTSSQAASRNADPAGARKVRSELRKLQEFLAGERKSNPLDTQGPVPGARR